MGLDGLQATVITVSDGVTAGERQDTSGARLEEMLTSRGMIVTRVLVSDDLGPIASAISEAASLSRLVVTTGGTGFGVRDVTPEATAKVIEREAPGLVHAMLNVGLDKTPMAALTRARAGAIGSCLVVNVPGSPKGAEESLEAIIDVIPHALQLLSGDNRHH